MLGVNAFQCFYNVTEDSSRLRPTEQDYTRQHPNRGSMMETETEGKKVFKSEISISSSWLQRKCMVQVQLYPDYFFFPVNSLNIQTDFLLNLDPLDVGQCTHVSCYIFLTMPSISCIMCTCS